MDPEMPMLAADGFMERFAAEGFALRYELEALTAVFERLLVSHSKSLQCGSIELRGVEFDLETCAGCYFGETLRTLYSGQRYGHLEPHSGANFYTARILFGEYLFSPFAWLGYRLSNGLANEGTVQEYVDAVAPSMRDGVERM